MKELKAAVFHYIISSWSLCLDSMISFGFNASCFKYDGTERGIIDNYNFYLL